MFENVPYVNFHDLNLDWIIKVITDFKSFVDNDLDGIISEKVQDIALNMSVSYEADTETLVFTIREV